MYVEFLSVKQEAQWRYQVRYKQMNFISVIYVEPHITQARGLVTISGKI